MLNWHQCGSSKPETVGVDSLFAASTLFHIMLMFGWANKGRIRMDFGHVLK